MKNINIVEAPIVPYNPSTSTIRSKDKYNLYAPKGGINKIGLVGFNGDEFVSNNQIISLKTDRVDRIDVIAVPRHIVYNKDGIKSPNTFYYNFEHNAINIVNGLNTTVSCAGTLLVTHVDVIDEDNWKQLEYFFSDTTIFERTLVVREGEIEIVTDFTVSSADILGTYYTKDVVDGKLALKADKTYTDAQLALKTDKTYTDAQLALKADKTYVDNELDEVDTELDTKADKTYTDAQLALKTDKTYTDTQLALKADKTYVDNEFDRVDTELDTKADKTYVDSQDTTIKGITTALQEQITALKEAGDVSGVVLTKAALLALDVSFVDEGTIIKVLTDESKQNKTNYYKLTSKEPVVWTFEVTAIDKGTVISSNGIELAIYNIDLKADKTYVDELNNTMTTRVDSIQIRVKTNEDDIAAIKSYDTSNDAEITAIKNRLTDSEGDIIDIQLDLLSKSTEIEELQDAVDDNIDELERIGEIVEDNQEAIISNDQDIADLQTRDTELAGLIDTATDLAESNEERLDNLVDTVLPLMNTSIEGAYTAITGLSNSKQDNLSSTQLNNIDNVPNKTDNDIFVAKTDSLQNQVTLLQQGSDLKYVVDTKASLDALDVSSFSVQNIVKVLIDETKDDKSTFYRLASISPVEWVYLSTDIDRGTEVTISGVIQETFEMNTKQDALSSTQLSNIADVPNKQDALSSTQLSNIADVPNKQDTLSSTQLSNIADVPNKVDKVTGKGLSTFDYSQSEKDRIDAVELLAAQTATLAATKADLVDGKVPSSQLPVVRIPQMVRL